MKIYEGWEFDRSSTRGKRYIKKDGPRKVQPGEIYLSAVDGTATRWSLEYPSSCKFLILQEYIPLYRRCLNWFKSLLGKERAK